MSSLTVKPKLITKENFKKFGDMISTESIQPLEINNGYYCLVHLDLYQDG